MFGYKGCQSKQEKLGMRLCSAAVAIGHEGNGFEKQEVLRLSLWPLNSIILFYLSLETDVA